MINKYKFSKFPKRHLLDIKGLKYNDIISLFDRANKHLKNIKNKNTVSSLLKDKIQINLFFEASTRTQTSFDIAGRNLGISVINMGIKNLSTVKGETLLDTVLTLNAMRPDIFIIRHHSSGSILFISKNIHCPIINAGDGKHEHPTQALLDSLTIIHKKGKIKDLIVVICGDILHSRVARSNINIFKILGAIVRVVGPLTLIPYGIEDMGVEVFTKMEEAIKNADVIIMLRLQRERMLGFYIPSKREYFHFFGLNKEKLSKAKKDCLVMHPGPINRGIEISSDIADGPQSVIQMQVEIGIAIRMAVIEALLET